MKLGLVLEGGAMRGIYTAGVLDVFMENDILVDGVFGVSAGSIHGASYVSRQPGRNIRYTKKYCKDWHFMSFRSFLTTGNMVGTEFCYDEIPNKLDPFDYDALKKNNMEFFAGTTNVETGKSEFLNCKEKETCLSVIRASSSMPVVSQIVEINGKKYLDGGTSESVPIYGALEHGYERNIVVLTQPAGYRKKKESLMPVMKKMYKKYPEFVKACEHRHENYNRMLDDLEQMEKEGKVIIIRPSVTVAIKRAEKDANMIQAQYDLGRYDATQLLDKIKAFVAESK